MSAYKEIECEIREEEYIIQALVDMGIPRENIEVHADSANLYGYKGDKRTQQANVIVRSSTINKYLSGGSSNDLGFEKIDGTFKAHVSDYDMKWWKQKEPRFKQVTACCLVEAKAKEKGYTVKKIEKNGTIKIKLTKNF